MGEGTRAEGPPAGFQAVKQRLSAQSGTPDAGRDSRSVQKLLEEYNRLEYEDIVAGMPTKFHYQEVSRDCFSCHLVGRLEDVCKAEQQARRRSSEDLPKDETEFLFKRSH